MACLSTQSYTVMVLVPCNLHCVWCTLETYCGDKCKFNDMVHWLILNDPNDCNCLLYKKSAAINTYYCHVKQSRQSTNISEDNLFVFQIREINKTTPKMLLNLTKLFTDAPLTHKHMSSPSNSLRKDSPLLIVTLFTAKYCTHSAVILLQWKMMFKVIFQTGFSVFTLFVI